MLLWRIRITKTIIALSLISASVFIFVLICGYTLNAKTFYKNIYVEGVDLSGKTLYEASEILKVKVSQEYINNAIALKYKNNTWQIKMADIGLNMQLEEALGKAYRLGRDGDLIQRLCRILKMRINPINISLQCKLNRDKLTEHLSHIKTKIDIQEKNASVSFKKGIITINKETVGKQMPIDKNIELLENRIVQRNFEDFEIYVEEKLPGILYSDIKEISSVLGTFTTAYNANDANRSHNIRLGAERLNNLLLMANDIFSMNEALGPRTLENGYLEAPVIFRNELVPGAGGGVCQVTTTLYNAVLLSGLEVLQRTHHSWPLGYVEPGRDATIADDYIDFKFQNSMGYPVCIVSEAAGGSLTISILGRSPEVPVTIRLKTQILEEYQPDGEEILVDNTVPETDKIVVREAKKGVKVVLYRETYNKGGELLNREKISEDIYKPVKAQVKVSQKYLDGLKRTE
ncbi:MAG: VanW family protein [Clostridia bacterium]|nr:VanW family protein [Clostridia bacterium]